MSGWARSDRSRYRAVSPSPLDDLTRQMHTKASIFTSKRLEKGINLLEEALAKCDTDDAYKSTLELYASHVQTQRADMAALRAELERAKKPVVDYRNKITVLTTNLEEKEVECVALRSRVDELEALLRSQDKSLDACCAQLSEERQWRKAAMECLKSELSLAKETAGLVSSVQKKQTTIPADERKAGKFSERMTSRLTKQNLERNDGETSHSNRPRSAPPRHLSSEESVRGEAEDFDGDSDGASVAEGRKKEYARDKEWCLDITAVSAVLSR